MNLRYTLFLFLFCLSTLSSLGQKKSNLRYEFYFGFGATNLMADIAVPPDSSKFFWTDFFNTIGYLGNTGLRYNLNDRHYVNLNLSLGTLYAYEQTYDAIHKPIDKLSNTFFTEISGRYELLVLNEKKKTTVYHSVGETQFKNFNLPAYLFVGIGSIFNVGKYTKTSNDGKSVDKSMYSNFSLVIPYGIGFKTRLSSTSYLNLEVGCRFVFSDNIDYVKHKSYDQYQFLTINYIKKIKAKENGLPKF